MNKLFTNSQIHHFLMVFVLFIGFFHESKGQTSPSGQAKFITPTTLSSCNTDTICLEITNLHGGKGISYAGKVKLEIDIPGGALIQYVPGSVSSKPLGATEISYIGKKLTIEAALPIIGYTTKVCFVVRPDCNITDMNTLPRFTGKIFYPAGYPTGTETFTSSPMNVGKTIISHSLYDQTTYGNPIPAFNTQYRILTNIKNSGYGTQNELVYTTINHKDMVGNFAYIYNLNGINSNYPTAVPNLLPVTTVAQGDYIIRTYILKGKSLGPDWQFTPGETIRFDEYMTPPSFCALYSAKRYVTFTCGTGTPDCIKPDTLYSTVTLAAGTPKLTGTLVQADDPDGCPAKTIIYKVKNTGVGNSAPVGNAYDVISNINFGGGNLEIADVKVNGVALPSNMLTPPGTLSKNFAIDWKDKNTNPAFGLDDIDGDGYYDDFKVGTEITISFTFTIPCEKACGIDLYYRLSSTNTFTDFCRSLKGSTSTFLKEFGFQQVKAIEQTKKVDFGILTVGESKIDTAKFQFQYKVFNVDMSNAVVELRINYRDKMELHTDQVLLNNVPLTNAPTILGSGADYTSNFPDPLVDNDSAAVYLLTPAEVTLLFDNDKDSLVYPQTYYGCTKRQSSTAYDNWQLLVKTKPGLCDDGSTPCTFDLACKKPWSYSAGQACGSVPCFIADIDVHREKPVGFTDVNLTTPIAAIDSLRSYEGDTVTVRFGNFINGLRSNIEPNGFYEAQGKPAYDLRYLFRLLYSVPTGYLSKKSIWEFLPGCSEIVIYNRTPDPAGANLKGTIGPVILTVPLLLEDFTPNGSNNAATVQNDYGISYTPYGGSYGSLYGGTGWYCNNSPNSWHINGLCPAEDGYYRNATTTSQNISYIRYRNIAQDKISENYYVNIGKALNKAGWTGSVGNPNIYIEVRSKWKMDKSFPWDNSNDWNVNGYFQHLGTYPLDYYSPASTYISNCNSVSATHLTVTKEYKIENPNAVYSADCGLRASNKIFFKSYQGDYFRDAEVRVPIQIDSVVVDVPTEYAVSAVSLDYHQGGMLHTTTAIANSASTGHVKFTNVAGGDFPRTDDMAGNNIVYDLSYTLSKTGVAAPTQYKMPIKIYTRDEFNKIILLIDTATITESKPEISITPRTPILQNTDGGSCQPAFFDFIIRNNTLFNAPNVYFAVESTAGTQITTVTDGDSVYVNPIELADISSYGANHKFVKIGTIIAGDVRVVRVFAKTNICSDDIKVFTDFGCAYPFPLEPVLSSSTLKTTTAHYVAAKPVILSRLTTGTMQVKDLCDSKDVEIEIRNADLSNIYKMVVSAKIPSVMKFVVGSAQIKHPLTGTYENIATVSTPVADSIVFDLKNNTPFTTSCGLTGSDTITRNDLRILFKVEFQACPNSSLDEILFEISGENYCGTKTTTQVVLPINYVGSAGKQNNYTISSKPGSIALCAGANQSQKVLDKLYIKNIGGFGSASGASSGVDSVLISIPINAAQMTLSNITVGAPFSSPVFGSDAQGNVSLRLLIPAGIAVGDSIALPINYDVIPKVDNLCSITTNPPICFFALFSSPVLLECTTSPSLSCGAASKSIRGSGLSLRTFVCCCKINITATQPVGCDNEGTFTPSDDKIKFTLNITNDYVGVGYTISATPGTITPTSGTYNNPIQFSMQAGSVGSGDVTITVTDNVKDTCQQTVVITDPKVCDLGGLCLIDASGLGSLLCHDANTPKTSADDYVSFSLNPTGLGLSSNYLISIISGGGSVTPSVANYGAPTSFQFNVGSASQKYKVVRITDTGNNGCTLDIQIDSPGTCSGCVNPPCVPINVIKN